MTRSPLTSLLAVVLSVVMWGVRVQSDTATTAADALNLSTGPLSPVTEELLVDPPPGAWLTHRGNREAWGYSALSAINRDTVGGLQLAWAWAVDRRRPQSQPLVHDGIMFVNQSSDVIEALDAASGDHIWTYTRDLPKGMGPLAFGNRNIAIYGDKIFLASADAHLVALSAETGEVVWDHEVADHALGFQYTGGPVIADGKVVAGMSGCYNYAPGGCFVSAHDPETGAEIWRRYAIPRAGEPGDDSWGVPVEERYGGSVWIAPSYDAERGILYVGTAVPVPWGRVQRASDGDLKNTNATMALDVKTGDVLWSVQHMPNDNFDFDHPFERHVVSTEVDPDPDAVRWIHPDLVRGPRDIIVGPWGKTAIIHAHDRVTGEFLWARETVYQNVVTDIDPQTARPTISLDLVHQTIGESKRICPSYFGGRNWPAVSYSPRTNALYMPLNNSCMDLAFQKTKVRLGKYHGSGRAKNLHAPGSKLVGRLEAVDVTTGRTIFKHEQRAAIFAPTLATAGGLVFFGDVAREFKALDDQTGEVLWRQKLDTAVHGYPISYEVDGTQYVAVVTGTGLSFSELTPEITIPKGAATLWVFKLSKL